MNEDAVTITKKEYFELRMAEAFLNHLQEAGGDNWQWYSYPGEEEERLYDEIFGEDK